MKKRYIAVLLLVAAIIGALLTEGNAKTVYASNRILKAGTIGIDVSSYQYVDWDTVKRDNYIQFAILRCGYGEDDPKQDDAQFQRNVSECKRLGIPFGVYLYSYAVNEKEAVSEAVHLKRMIGDSKPEMGVYLDVEDTEYYKRHNIDVYTDSGKRTLTDLVKTVLENLSDTGWVTGIYANYSYYTTILHTDELSAYKWVAYWPNLDNQNQVAEVENKVKELNGVLWQYCSDGRVNGVMNAKHQESNVDMDKLLVDWELGVGETVLEPEPDFNHTQECVPGALGDVNNDGAINISDVIILKKYLAKCNDININVKAANVNKDYDEQQEDILSVNDVIIILKSLAGLDTIKLGEVLSD